MLGQNFRNVTNRTRYKSTYIKLTKTNVYDNIYNNSKGKR